MRKYRKRRKSYDSAGRSPYRRKTGSKIVNGVIIAVVSSMILGILSGVFAPISQGAAADPTDPTVPPVTDSYIPPSGTLNITSNGLHNVAQYESVNVNVSQTVTGGDCAAEHIIEVDELPTENIDESAVYGIGTESKAFADIAVVEDGDVLSYKALAPGANFVYCQTKPTDALAGVLYYVEDEDDVYLLSDGSLLSLRAEGMFVVTITNIDQASVDTNGFYPIVTTEKTFEYFTFSSADKGFFELYGPLMGSVIPYSQLGGLMYHYADTTPSDDEIIQSTSGSMHLYYVADLNDIYYKNTDGNWVRYLKDGETVRIINSSAQVDYTLIDNIAQVVVSDGWTRYFAPSGSLTVTENGVYDSTDFESVIVDTPVLPDAAICGTWQINATDFDSLGTNGTVEITVNFTTVISGETKNCTKIRAHSSDGIDYSISYYLEDGTRVDAGGGTYYEFVWTEDSMRTVDFGDDPQLVFTKGKNWLVANAVPVEATAPQKYSITYDLSALSHLEILAQPTEIYEGQTVYFVFATNNGFLALESTVTNCEYEGTSYSKYISTEPYWPTVVAISNPTGDVTVTLALSQAGGAA